MGGFSYGGGHIRGFPSVYRQFRPQAFGHIQLFPLDIHRDDPSPHGVGDHYGREADTPTAVNGYPFTGPQPGLGFHGSERGGEAAPQTGDL